MPGLGRRSDAAAPGADVSVDAEDRKQRVKRLRGMAFALVYDLSCWLSRTYRTAADIEGYGMTRYREIEDPRERLLQYVNRPIIDAFEQQLAPWFQTASRIEIDLGESAKLKEDGILRGAPIQAVFQPTLRYRIFTPGRQPRPSRTRNLDVYFWCNAEVTRVANIVIRDRAE